MVIKRHVFVWGAALALLLGAWACQPKQQDDNSGKAEGEPTALDDDKVVEYYEGLSDKEKSGLMGRLHGGDDGPADEDPSEDDDGKHGNMGAHADEPDTTADESGDTEATDSDEAADAGSSDQLPERTGITARGPKELTLLGPDLEVGDTIPSFELKTTEMKPFTEMDLQGKWALISVVPSLDTPVCETQTTTLGAKREEMPENSVFVTVSRDLPFAQRRFNQTHPMDTVLVSDYADASFGKKFGVLVKETGLLARSLWLVNPDGEIVYRQIVADQGTEPDYDAMMSAMASSTAN